MVLHRCSFGPLFHRPIVSPVLLVCCEMHQYYRHPIAPCLLHSFQDEQEQREMAALLGCLNGFMSSIYLYKLTQTHLNPNLNQFRPNPNLSLTSIHTLPLNLVLQRCSADLLMHFTTCGGTVTGRNSELAERWVGPLSMPC